MIRRICGWMLLMSPVIGLLCAAAATGGFVPAVLLVLGVAAFVTVMVVGCKLAFEN